jgi:NADH:ubiquinone oxidoreductase subunit 3 (subunit A)
MNIVIFTVDLVYLFSICGSNQLHDHIINLLKILTFILVNLTAN